LPVTDVARHHGAVANPSFLANSWLFNCSIFNDVFLDLWLRSYFSPSFH
jgi:hypothetical protein